ncbi:hypothetical protein Tco_1501602 [Tanacetum coccineum]
MVMRSTMISQSSPLLIRFMHSRPAIRFFSDQGRVLEEEGRARENLYVQKEEKEKLEKQKQKMAEKEKAEKEKADAKCYIYINCNADSLILSVRNHKDEEDTFSQDGSICPSRLL